MESLQEIFGWVQVLLVGVLVYFLPGWALLELCWPDPASLRWPEKVGLSAGVSLAVYPVILLVANQIGIQPGPAMAVIPILLGLAGLAWKFRSTRLADVRRSFLGWLSGLHRYPDLALGALILIALGVRLLAVQGLEAPMWGDSYQHSLITRLLVENGGLFESWEPYEELQSFTYHFGFHAQAAAMEWLTPLDSPQAVLITGQILNLLAVITLVPLALKTGGKRWAGVFALMIAGLLAPMPMAYTNWGRYTQLAGQAILPAVVMVGWVVLDSDRTFWRTIGLGWIAIAGLALTHYRVLLIAGVFFAAYLLIRIWRPGRLVVFGRLAALGAGAFLIFLPWLARLLGGPLADLAASQLSTPPSSDSVWALYNALDLANLGNFLHPILWLATLASAVAGIVLRRRNYVLITLWWALLVLATNPNWILLPGAGLMSNFAIAIAAYIPAAVLTGSAAGELVESLRSRGRASQTAPEEVLPKEPPGWAEAALLVFVLSAGLLGGISRLGDIDPEAHALVTEADRAAMDWIQLNLPQETRFHVNQFFAFSDSVTVGADAGWWIPLLAERKTDLPPINYGFEIGPRPDYREWINELPALILERGIDSPEVLAAFEQRGLTHIYLGQRQGRVNHDGSQALDPQTLLDSPNFDLVYQRDGVYIFMIN